MLLASFLTVTLHWVLSPLYVFAEIVAVPMPTAVILPLSSTVITSLLSVVNSTCEISPFSIVVIRVYDSPTPSVIPFLLNFTLLGGTVGFGSVVGCSVICSVYSSVEGSVTSSVVVSVDSVNGSSTIVVSSTHSVVVSVYAVVSVYSVVTSVQAEEESDIVVSVNSIFSVVIFGLSVDASVP